MNVKIKRTGDIAYAVWFLFGKKPIAFFDYHRKEPCDARFAKAVRTLHAFKNDDAEVVAAFSSIGAQIAKADFSMTRITHVAPTLGSGDLSANPRSRTYIVAAAVADALGAELDTTTFFHSETREKLHYVKNRNAADRSDLVASVLRANEASGRRVLIVDDVLTTGSTIQTYAGLLEDHGGYFAGAIAMMKYENDEELLNPDFFEKMYPRV